MTLSPDLVFTRIRNRKSYEMWKKAYKFLSENHTTEEILLYFHDLLDSMHAYGSSTLSEFSHESLRLVVLDGGSITV